MTISEFIYSTFYIYLYDHFKHKEIIYNKIKKTLCIMQETGNDNNNCVIQNSGHHKKNQWEPISHTTMPLMSNLIFYSSNLLTISLLLGYMDRM